MPENKITTFFFERKTSLVNYYFEQVARVPRYQLALDINLYHVFDYNLVKN